LYIALRLILLFILSLCFSQAWASVAVSGIGLLYGYDENAEYSYDDFGVETSGINNKNHTYDDGSNISLCCSGQSARLNSQQAREGYFFAFLDGLVAAKGVTNPVPSNLARVVPGNVNPKTLGRTGDVFVTDANALKGLNSKQIADKLTIPQSSSGFKVIEFPSSNVSGIASPINRTNPGFIQGGRTAGGAPEFVIPNGPIPAGATTRVVP